MSDETVIVINEGLEQRTTKSGKTRFTVKIKSEPLVHNLDPKALGTPVAAAIVHHYRERVKGITATASPATLKARKVEAKAFAAGKPWAVKKFSGGRLGPMAPNQSDRMFNDSGRFASSITGNASSKGAWRINVASNRLSGDAGMVSRIWNKLVGLVPEFGNPALLLDNMIIRKSIERARDGMIKKLAATERTTFVSVAKAAFKTLETFGDLLAG